MNDQQNAMVDIYVDVFSALDNMLAATRAYEAQVERAHSASRGMDDTTPRALAVLQHEAIARGGFDANGEIATSIDGAAKHAEAVLAFMGSLDDATLEALNDQGVQF